MKFTVERNQNELIIKQNLSSGISELMVEIIGFLMTLLVFLFPIDQLTGIHEYLVGIYLIPIISLIMLIRKSLHLTASNTFSMDKRTDQILYNDKYLDSIKNIEQVEWNIDSISDHTKSFLELKSINNRRHRISTTSTTLNKEHLDLGRLIAQFLKVKFINNHSWEDDVLWGNHDVDEISIDHIENKSY